MNTEAINPQHPSRLLVVAAFGGIYLIWGSTYLAIRVAVETLPPFLMAGVRFLLAGATLFAWLRLRGVSFPAPIHWRNAAIGGTLLLVAGNGLVVWAEQSVTSSLTALLIALTPVWFALADWLRPGGVRPEVRTIAGILVGFIGVALLLSNRGAHDPGSSVSVWGFLALVGAGIFWASGSLFTRHVEKAESPWMNAATQMICGGVGLVIVALLAGEPWQTDWNRFSRRSLLALAYLIVCGSWIGYGAYLWLLQVSTPARVATYAYVNPVIAVFLGWALLGERVDGRIFLGAFVIVTGVAIITIPKSAIEAVLPRSSRNHSG